VDFVNEKSLENYFIWKFYWFFVEERGPDGKYPVISTCDYCKKQDSYFNESAIY
jgi:hypothetical protein